MGGGAPKIGKREADEEGQKIQLGRNRQDGLWRDGWKRGAARLASALCLVEALPLLARDHPLPVLAQPHPRQQSSLGGMGANLGTFIHLILLVLCVQCLPTPRPCWCHPKNCPLDWSCSLIKPRVLCPSPQ